MAKTTTMLADCFCSTMFNVNLYREVSVELGAVRVLPVTKYSTVNDMKEALMAGAEMLAESRVQDAEKKFFELIALGYERESFKRHLIGHLQTNKVKKAVEVFDVIQSVDSVKVAMEISKSALEIGRVIEVYLQVNAAGDESKFGFGVAEVFEAAEVIALLPSLRIGGLMMIGKFGVSDDETRSDFEKMKTLFDEFKMKGLFGVDDPVLSMGMSGDYELAVQCGATMVRLGSVLFK